MLNHLDSLECRGYLDPWLDESDLISSLLKDDIGDGTGPCLYHKFSRNSLTRRPIGLPAPPGVVARRQRAVHILVSFVILMAVGLCPKDAPLSHGRRSTVVLLLRTDAARL